MMREELKADQAFGEWFDGWFTNASKPETEAPPTVRKEALG